MSLHLIVRALLFVMLSVPIFANADDKQGVRGARYCEIFLQQKGLSFAVYNTFGLSDCPENLWKNINVSSIKKETGSFYVHINGPRYFMMDGFKDTTLISDDQRVIAGIPMRIAGIIHLSPWELIQKAASYRPQTVKRHTTWVYDKNKPVFELINPKGEVFVMQSYSVQQTPQTEISLSTLGDRLHLPKDWHFKTGVTNQINYVKAHNDEAVVVQDEFLNTYQKADADFLD